MATSSIAVKKDLSSSKHHVCSGNLCVPSSAAPDVLERHKAKIAATFVDRRSASDHPLMQATQFLGMVQPGASFNLSQAFDLSVDKASLAPESADSPEQVAKELAVCGQWRNRKQEIGVSGRDANVFGALGVLAVEAEFGVLNIPVQNALSVSPTFLQAYGAQLVPVDQTFTVPATGDTGEEVIDTLYMTEYTWNPGYIAEYVMKPNGGGGLFVETHPFPHIFTPLEATCGGALILGRQGTCSENYYLAAFKIPYGYSMVVDSNVIHGDSFFTGKYAIALTETELADSVLLKCGDVEDRAIKCVSQSQAVLEKVPAPISLSNKLMWNTAVKQLAKDLSQTTNPARISAMLGFFRSAPKETLIANRDQNPYLQQEYDKQFGLVVSATP